MRSRRRLPSQARTVAVAPPLEGRTLLTRNTSSRRPSIASPTSSSAAPSAYISAVSIKAMPRSMPRRRASISSLRARGCSAKRQVPIPSTGMRSPDFRVVVRTPVSGTFPLYPVTIRPVLRGDQEP